VNDFNPLTFNVLTESWEDFLQTGIVDPTKVVITALEKSSSVASMLLTTECVITDKPEKIENKKPVDPMQGII
jgi:chaperonin GroEL